MFVQNRERGHDKKQGSRQEQRQCEQIARDLRSYRKQASYHACQSEVGASHLPRRALSW